MRTRERRRRPMRLFTKTARLLLAAWLTVAAATPAYADGLRAAAEKAAQQAAPAMTTEPRSNVMKWTGLGLFVGGMSVGLYCVHPQQERQLLRVRRGRCRQQEARRRQPRGGVRRRRAAVRRHAPGAAPRCRTSRSAPRRSASPNSCRGNRDVAIPCARWPLSPRRSRRR